MNKILPLVLLNFLFLINATTQCNVTLSASQTTLPCHGGQVVLTANGTAQTQTVLNTTFDNGNVGAGWSLSPAGQFNNPCGGSFDGGTHMWMGSSTAAPRTMQTANFDVSCGGQVCFYLKYSTQGNSSPCEGPDASNEGVNFQYSTNGGSTWTLINYFTPQSTSNLLSWRQYCFSIPAAAQTSNTIFRWYQSGSSGSSYDHWGIDNVEINAINCNSHYYDWTHVNGTGDEGNSSTVNITSNGTYTVTYLDGQGSSCSQSISINLQSVSPSYTANSECVNTQTNFIDASNYAGDTEGSWQWNFGDGNTSTVQNPSHTYSSPGTYNVQLSVTTNNNCVGTTTVPYTVHALPNTNAGSDFTTNCINPTHTLAGGGGGNYVWSPASGLSNPNISNPVANPTTNTTYTLTVTDGNGCVNTDDVNINVDKGIPTVAAGNDFTTNCITPTHTLNGSGSGSYSWSPSSGLSNATIANPVANPSTTTNYTLTVTGSNGCTDTEDVEITVDKGLPSVNAGTDFTTTCTTPTYTINGTGSGTYQWSPSLGLSDATIATPVATPSTTTTYTLTTTGANGCTNSDDVIITVDQNYPIVPPINDVTLNCNTSNGTFAAAGGNTYSWSTPSGGGSVQSLNVDYTNLAGDYVVTVTALNGCEVVDSSRLFVDTIVPVSNAGLDSVLTCTALLIDLNGDSSSTGTEYTYSWSTSDGNLTQGTNTTSPTIDNGGTYTITVLDTINHCWSIDSVVVGLDTIHPIAEAGLDSIITCNVPEINLSGLGSSNGNFSYYWMTPNGTIVGSDTIINPLINSGGTYSITVTNNYNGCSSMDNVFIDEDITADVEILSSSNQIDSIFGIAPHDVDFSWVGDNGTVVWDFGDNNTSTDSSVLHTYNLRGNYTAIIILTDTEGCIAYDTVYVDIDGREIIFPNVFTPNGDGQNDIFTFRGERIKSFECSIFNRWGQVVYSWNAPVGGWDGRSFAGKELPSGEYFYILKAIDRDDNAIERTGNIMLMK